MAGSGSEYETIRSGKESHRNSHLNLRSRKKSTLKMVGRVGCRDKSRSSIFQSYIEVSDQGNISLPKSEEIESGQIVLEK